MVKPSATIHGRGESRDDELKRKGDEFLDAIHAFVMGDATIMTRPRLFTDGFGSEIKFVRKP